MSAMRRAAPRFLTLADVAEVLNTSSAQVYALVRRRRAQAIKIGGRGQWRVEASELEDFIQRMYDETRDVRRQAPVRGRRRRPVGASRRRSRRAQPTSEPRVTASVCSSSSRVERELDRLAGLVGPDRHDQGDPVGDPRRRRPR